jgi:CheY-like chemotaxis protein|tara:strand:- start:5595 stop:7874 length:2280 start_codon:yes stop_codon:yes gene_type:complete
MKFEELVAKQAKLDDLNMRFAPLLGSEMDSLKRANSIEDAATLEAALKEVESTDRTLRIGVVGRMKAGKSSLLNALLFSGNSVLPKAATPMTAALTTISWGESVSAEVEFYSLADRRDIARKAVDYEAQFESIVAEKRKGLLQKYQERRKQKSIAGMEQGMPDQTEDRSAETNAKKAAELEMKKQVKLHAAYDQYQRMKRSSVKNEDLGETRSIEANDLESLKGMLGDYVSAHGKYMPFCKSVHIKLPLESLRGLEVVDTPGFNDPVISREERTNEILGRCDVVLIVSPSGRLLTKEDMTLMGRISQKEGVQELYVIASQADAGLHGSERRDNLAESLEVIQAKNSQRAEEVFRLYCDKEPEAREVFGQILEDADNRVVCVSGMASSIAQKLDQGKPLDRDQQNTLRMINTSYPDEMNQDDDASVSAAMKQLAGMDAVRKILASANNRKTEILEARKQNFSDTKLSAIQGFSAQVVDFGKRRVQELEKTDLNELNSEIVHLKTTKETLSLQINHEFRDHRVALPKNMRSELRTVLKKAYREAESGVDESEDDTTRTRTLEKSGFGAWCARKLWGGGSKTESYTVTTVATSRASKSVAQFVNNVADDMEDAFNTVREEWRKAVHKTIVKAYRDIVGDEGVDKRLVLRAISDLVESLELGEFGFDRGLPARLKARGTLEGSEADDFLDKSRDFIADLHGKITNAISSCIDSIDVSLPDDVAFAFYKELDERVELLKEQILNKEESLARFAELDRLYRGVAQ